MRIPDSVFLVTGGSSGLGAACVRMLIGHGARVVIADVNKAEGDKLVSELGLAVRLVQTDVTDEAGLAGAIQTAVESFGGLHGVVNCAGIIIAERLVGKNGPHDLASFARVINVNLIGTFNVMRLAAAVMAGNAPLASGERGIIINTASVAAFDGQIGQAAYAASKGGVASMTLPLARELARFGIRVMAIAPGIFDTPMLAKLSDETRRSLGEQVPFPPRLGRPDEYADLVRHIIENEMLNGTVIRLDGALRMAAK